MLRNNAAISRGAISWIRTFSPKPVGSVESVEFVGLAHYAPRYLPKRDPDHEQRQRWMTFLRNRRGKGSTRRTSIQNTHWCVKTRASSMLRAPFDLDCAGFDATG